MSSPLNDNARAPLKDTTMTAVVSPAPRSRASSAMSLPGPLSRPGSVQAGLLGGRKSLPNIPHPMSRMGSRGTLNVRGESRLGHANIPPGGGPPAGRVPPHDAGSGAFGPRGVYHYNTHDGNLPPLRPCSVAAALLPAENAVEKDWCGRSQASEEGPLGGRYSWTPEAMHHYGRSSAASKPRRSADVTKRYDTSQLQQIISDKVNSTNSGQYLRHLFNAHDPNQQGNISREALLKILYDVCGYITNNQYSSLLHSLGLEGKPVINFDQFVSHFRETTETPKEWVSPVHKMEIQPSPAHIEGDRRHDNPNRVVTASFCFVTMKDKAKKMQLNLRAHLPASCFSDDGVIIPPQMRDLVRGLGMHLSEDEMVKLWQRFDTENVGLVRTYHFLRTLGLDENGEPRVLSPKKVTIDTTDPPYSPVSQEGVTAPIEVQIDPKNWYREDIEIATPPRTPVPTPPGEELVDTPGPMLEETPKIPRQFIKRKRMTPNMERVMDCLHFKFEEPLHAFKKGCELFDFLGDGFISRIDFKHVLEEFGLPVAAIDLEHFLSRCGIRTMHGQIPYNEFLNKYWNRTESGIVNRIVTNSFHRFNQGPVTGSGDGMTLTAEELEAKLVEFFHGDFMALLGACRRHDKYDLGVVKPSDFRPAIERLLGFNINDSQWDALKREAEVDKDGLVPYPTFLDKFNISPGAWNQRRHNGILVSKVRTTASPPQVERLRQKARQMDNDRNARLQDKEDKGGRSIVELDELMKDVIRMKFHSFDKAFKKIDRKMTGRFHMHQLDEMLKECNVVLTRSELIRLWTSLNVSADGLFNFSSFVRHFVQRKQEPPPIQGKLPMDDEGPEDPLALPEFVPIPHVGESDANLIEQVRQFRRDQKAQKKAATVKQTNYVNLATSRVTSNERNQLLDKIKGQVVQQWDTLKRVFRQMDQNGQAFIKQDQMLDVMNLLEFPLSEEDRNKLLQQFDKKGNGNFHYMDFLSIFTDSKCLTNDKENRPPSNNHVFSNTNMEHQFMPRYAPFIMSAWARKLQRDWKLVRRSFQKADRGGTGELPVNQFKGALRKCGISIGGEDLYEILSEFDAKMQGKIAYEEFLNRILSLS